MSRWSTAVLAILSTTALAPATALAAGDAAATQAYLRADLRLVQTASGRLSVARSAIDGVAARLRSECPRAAANSPQDPQSTELSNELIGAMVTAAIHPDLGNIRDFLRSVSGLRWSSRPVAAAIHAYVTKLRTMASLAAPNVCADIHSWASSGFTHLSGATAAFSPRFMESWVALGEQPAALGRLESAGARSLAQQAAQHEQLLTEFEAGEVENWGRMMNSLELSP